MSKSILFIILLFIFPLDLFSLISNKLSPFTVNIKLKEAKYMKICNTEWYNK